MDNGKTFTIEKPEPTEKPAPEPIDFGTLEYGTWLRSPAIDSTYCGVIGRFIGVSVRGDVELRDARGERWATDTPEHLRLLRPDEVPS